MRMIDQSAEPLELAGAVVGGPMQLVGRGATSGIGAAQAAALDIVGGSNQRCEAVPHSLLLLQPGSHLKQLPEKSRGCRA